MKKFLIYTTLILVLFFSLNVPAILSGDLEQAFSLTSVHAQTDEGLTVVDILRYSKLGWLIRATEGGLDLASSFAKEVAAGIYLSFERVAGFIANLILGAFSWLVFLSGMLLNLTITITVVNMSAVINNISAITDGWEIFRNLSNIAFIFILLYISISMILGLTSIDVRKTITKVIVVALLINFSLFFTKALVDVSNITTIHFFNLAGQSAGDATEESLLEGINDLDNGLSFALMEHLKLPTIYKTASRNIQGNANSEGAESILSRAANLIPRLLFSSWLMLLAALIFFITSFFFIARFVILIFLMMTAPLAFIAMILPQTSGTAKKWWSTLSSQLIFAPVYMILTFITLKIMKSISTNDVLVGVDSSGSSLGNALFSSGATGFVALLQFFIIFAFMVGTLIIAKRAGASGGDWVTKVGASAVLGGAGWVGRNTAGRLGRNIADSEKLKNIVEDKNSSAFDRAGARMVLRAGDYVAKSSFDARNKAGDAIGTLSGQLGGGKINLGKSYKGGYDEQLKAEDKKATEIAKMLDPGAEQVALAEREVQFAKESGDSERIKRAQDQMDYLKGVNEKEAKKRANKIVEERKPVKVKKFKSKSDGEDQADYEKQMKKFYQNEYGVDSLEKAEEEAEKEVEQFYQSKYGTKDRKQALEKEAKKIQEANKGIGAIRKEQYARDIEDSSWLLKLASFRTQSQLNRAAAAVRKAKAGKKKVEELVNEALETNKEAEPKEEGGDTSSGDDSDSDKNKT